MRVPRRVVLALASAVLAGAPPAWPQTEGPPPLIVFALDTSGSLAPADLGRAGALASGILAQLPPGAEAALFTFDDDARLAVRRTSRPGEIAKALAGLRRQGRHTALNDALYDATRYL